MKHVTGVIASEAARQKREVTLMSERQFARHLIGAGWVDCSKGAQMIWVHPDLRNPADGDQVFVVFQDAVEIQSRWELGWPYVSVNAAPTYTPDAPTETTTSDRRAG